jgi:hypothetical protein
MNGNKYSKYRLTFKSSEVFSFPETGEYFRTTVKLTASQVVRLRLHDFNASFTSVQAYNEGFGLIQAIMTSNGHDKSKYNNLSIKRI